MNYSAVLPRGLLPCSEKRPGKVFLLPAPRGTGQLPKDCPDNAAAMGCGRQAIPKGQPKRSAGCAAKIYEDANVHHYHCTLSQSELDRRFGKDGWKEMPSGDPFFKGNEFKVYQAGKLFKYIVGWSTDLEEAKKNHGLLKKSFPDSFLVKVENGVFSRVN